MKKYIHLIATVTLGLMATGCGSLLGINLFVVDEKTALEQQVLGTYETIGTDLASHASVRGVNPDGTVAPRPKMTESQRAVMQALNNRRYNRDDLNLLLTDGIVGEGQDGMIVVLSDQIPTVANLTPDLIREVIEEENADRAVILQRLMETTPGVGPDDRAEVERIFAGLNRDLAPAGSRIQQADGSWSAK